MAQAHPLHPLVFFGWTASIEENVMSDKQRVQALQRQLTELTAAFCGQHADAEYEHLCKKLIDKMARKRAVPFLSGRLEIWAAAIVYALGSINFLFDKSSLPHATPDTICDFFQVSKRTITQKAKLIRDMLKLGYFDPEFSTEHMAKNNPLTRLRMVNGFLVIDEP
jgi:Domain of unknown function (DUF6398)